MSESLLLIAASGLARETASVFRAVNGSGAGWPGGPLIGFLDDDSVKIGTTIDGLLVLGRLDSVVEHADARLVICAGKGIARRAIATRLAGLGVTDDRYLTVIDPSVRVPANCHIGAGSILLAGTVLTSDVTMGRHVVCMPKVTLTHDDVLEDFVTLAAGVSIGGGVRIGEAAYLGMNASVRELCRVGAQATLGMGSVLLTDQPAESIWAGVPARELTRRKDHS